MENLIVNDKTPLGAVYNHKTKSILTRFNENDYGDGVDDYYENPYK